MTEPYTDPTREPLVAREAPAGYEAMLNVQGVRPGYKMSEVGVIPEEWGVRSISNEIDRLEAGVSVNSVDEERKTCPHEQSILKTSAVTNGRFLAHEAKKIAPRDIPRAQLNPRADTIIVSRMNTPDLVGECGYVDKDYPDLFLPDRLWMTRVRFGSVICVKWLAYLLAGEEYKRRLKGAATGTSGSMKNLSKNVFLSLSIPFPGAEEQRAIAAALSDVDALLAKLDQLIAKKRDLKQAAMQQLLTGQTRLPGFSGEWEVRRLGDVAQLKNGYAFQSSTYTDLGRYKVVTIANVQDGFMTVAECNRIAQLPQDIQSHQRLCRNDILISMTGNVGRVCRVSDDDCLLNQRVGKMVPTSVDARFLFVTLRQPKFLVAMGLKAKGGAQGNLSKPDITEYEVYLPSLPEQTAIATVLSDMDAELAALEARRDKTRALKQGMMQELLTGRIRLV
jgi:type I restriction enzyme S subunit